MQVNNNNNNVEYNRDKFNIQSYFSKITEPCVNREYVNREERINALMSKPYRDAF